MDRGFTVEGLTVTYMPRTAGRRQRRHRPAAGEVLRLQAPYLGLCRIFVAGCPAAFRGISSTRRMYGAELAQFAATNRPLSEWRREFFLSRQLRPTRDNVIDIAYQRLRFGNEWVYPNGPHDSAGAVLRRMRRYSLSSGRRPVRRLYGGPDLRQNQPPQLRDREYPSADGA